MTWYENESLLRTIIENSYSYAQALRKIGLRDSGCNYLTLKRALLKFDIKFESVQNHRPPSTKMSMSEILVENSTYSNTKRLKKRLIKDGYFEHKCYKCNNNMWMGQKIPLQLEHKNGKRTDCRIENLTLLCPNCHAQTETYCGKNKRKYSKLMIQKEEKYQIKQQLNFEKSEAIKIKKSKRFEIRQARIVKKQEWIEKRKKDVKDIGQSWGYISKLSEMWNISHTQVRRFLENYCPEMYVVS